MQWTKTATATYALLREADPVPLTEMTFFNGQAECQLPAGRLLRFRRRGFWRPVIELLDGDRVLTALHPVNWYTERWHFNLYGSGYELLIRNNPLAEYAIQQGGQDMMAVGLKVVDGQAVAQIRSGRAETEPGWIELHALLWYCFQPIALGETAEGGAMEPSTAP